ncbi:hypothetical protein AB0F72_08615 [Actinoplanes sp. NPDC023936]|uniref:hypothetical protein n=1 Tax=Actinoplanes sp. NPDC023936 TaxID=3154910 RepID=UPI0033C1F86C
MTADELTPLHEWEPALKEQVAHWRAPQRLGTVLRCDQYGHFADPYWRVTVRWDDTGGVEHNIETSCLVRPDGTQGLR